MRKEEPSNQPATLTPNLHIPTWTNKTTFREMKTQFQIILLLLPTKMRNLPLQSIPWAHKREKLNWQWERKKLLLGMMKLKRRNIRIGCKRDLGQFNCRALLPIFQQIDSNSQAINRDQSINIEKSKRCNWEISNKPKISPPTQTES